MIAELPIKFLKNELCVWIYKPVQYGGRIISSRWDSIPHIRCTSMKLVANWLQVQKKCHLAFCVPQFSLTPNNGKIETSAIAA